MNKQRPTHMRPVERGGGISTMRALGLSLLACVGVNVFATSPCAATPAANEHFGYAVARGDFNCDTIEDLAVGAPFEDVWTTDTPSVLHTDAGAVYIYLGGSSAWTTSKTPDLTLTVDFVDPTFNGGSDNFGWALSAGDFDGDHPGCKDDLAVGSPATAFDEGQVHVVYLEGTTMTRADRWNMHTLWAPPGTGRTPIRQGWNAAAAGKPISSATITEKGDPANYYAYDKQAGAKFGYALTTGDFNGDGDDDLAIGAPYWSDFLTGQDEVGLVAVLYGNIQNAAATGTNKRLGFRTYEAAASSGCGSNGTFSANRILRQYPTFGGFDTQTPYLTNSGIANQTASYRQVVFAAFRANVQENAEAYDRFGFSLAAAVLDHGTASEQCGADAGENCCSGTCYSIFPAADLVIGVPGEDYEGTTNSADAGAVCVSNGSGGFARDNPISLKVTKCFFESDWGVTNGTSNPLAGDWFGCSVATGMFNRTPSDPTTWSRSVGTTQEYWTDYQNVAVGACGCDPEFGACATSATTRGRVFINYADIVVRTTAGVCNTSEFVGGGNYSASSPTVYPTLQVISQDSYSLRLKGTSATVTVQSGDPITNDVPNATSGADLFGRALAVGNFNAASNQDLLIGAPYQSTTAYARAGMAHILYSSASGVATGTPGLSVASDVLIYQGQTNRGGVNSNAFGWCAAAGDYNGNGYDDVAVGAPNRTVSSYAGAGTVVPVYGTSSGTTTAGVINDP